MKYTITMDINAPRDSVVELFDNPDNMAKWQPDLISRELIEGEVGQEGAKSKLRYKMGKSEIEMIEVILDRKLPDVFNGTYESKGVWNRCDNRFIVKDDTTTRWEFDSEFKCTGFMRLMVWLAPSMFKKTSVKYMEQFKEFVESQKG